MHCSITFLDYCTPPAATFGKMGDHINLINKQVGF